MTKMKIVLKNQIHSTVKTFTRYIHRSRVAAKKTNKKTDSETFRQKKQQKEHTNKHTSRLAVNISTQRGKHKI